MRLKETEVERIARHKTAITEILEQCKLLPVHYSVVSAILKKHRLTGGLMTVMVELNYMKRVNSGTYLAILPYNQVEPHHARKAMERCKERWPSVTKKEQIPRRMIYAKIGRSTEEEIFMVDQLQKMYIEMCSEDPSCFEHLKTAHTLDELKTIYKQFFNEPYGDAKIHQSEQQQTILVVHEQLHEELEDSQTSTADEQQSKELVEKRKYKKRKNAKTKEFSLLWGLISFKW